MSTPKRGDVTPKLYRDIYAIPDIHGEISLLRKAMAHLTHIGFDTTKDALVFLGDMIDRGPDSCAVIQTIKDLVETHSGAIFALRGNHEDLALDYYLNRKFGKADARDLWFMNGGNRTEWSYENRTMSEDHIKWIASLPYHLEKDGFFFSHAPVGRGKSRKHEPYSVSELTWTYFGPECERPGAMMWVHEGPLSSQGLGAHHMIGVCGHIHRGPKVKEVRVFPNYRMLDTGCGCWDHGRLAIHECKSAITHYVDNVVPDQRAWEEDYEAEGGV